MQVIKSTKNSRILDIVIEGRRTEGFYFDDIKQREHFCQLIQQMKKVHSQQADVDSLSVFCGTWNMGKPHIECWSNRTKCHVEITFTKFSHEL